MDTFLKASFSEYRNLDPFCILSSPVGQLESYIEYNLLRKYHHFWINHLLHVFKFSCYSTLLVQSYQLEQKVGLMDDSWLLNLQNLHRLILLVPLRPMACRRLFLRHCSFLIPCWPYAQLDLCLRLIAFILLIIDLVDYSLGLKFHLGYHTSLLALPRLHRSSDCIQQ